MNRKTFVFLAPAVALLVWGCAPPSWSEGTAVAPERDVKIFRRTADGSLVEAELTRPARAAVQPSGETFLLDDFEDGDLKNQLLGESGTWNLDPDDEAASVEMKLVDTDGPRGKPTKALRLAYDVDSARPAQLGFWSKLMLTDLSGYDHLAFDARIDPQAGGSTKFEIEVKQWKEPLKIEKLQGSHRFDGLTTAWRHYEIPLNWMNGILKWERLDEFVIVLQDRAVDKKQGALLFDNIAFLKTGRPGPGILDEVPRRITQKSPTRLEGQAWAEFLAKRLGGFPTATLLKKDFPKDDRAFLLEVAHDTWGFFDHIVDQEHALPLDTIALSRDTPMGPDTWVGDFTNVTNIGLYFMCLPAAQNFGFINREQALERVTRTLATVEKLERAKENFLYNYYDTTTLDRTSHFASLVDSGWLAAGLIVVKAAYPELSERVEKLLASWNFKFFYDEVDQQFWHGYYTNIEHYAEYHYGTFYTEPRATSYLAIARGDVPLDVWYQTLRTFPEDYGWQSRPPVKRIQKPYEGGTFYGGTYEWEGLRYVPCWGGSLFEALMPTVMLKERELSPESLGRNNHMHVKGHILAASKLGYPVWGMSPSSVPGDGYSEYGVKELGVKGYKSGVVTPHVSVLALEYEPQAVVQNLRALIERYPIYGAYGFYDAVNPESGRVAYKYLCLDQGMIFLALSNYLKDGFVRELFHADPKMKALEPLLAKERFFEP